MQYSMLVMRYWQSMVLKLQDNVFHEGGFVEHKFKIDQVLEKAVMSLRK